MVLSASSCGLHHSTGNRVCDVCSTKFNENMSATMQLSFVDWLYCTNFFTVGLVYTYLGHRKRKKRHNTVWWWYIYIPLQANMKTSVCFKPTSNATNTATVNRHFEKWSARLRASQRYTASSQVFTVNWHLTVVDSWPEIRNSLVKNIQFCAPSTKGISVSEGRRQTYR